MISTQDSEKKVYLFKDKNYLDQIKNKIVIKNFCNSNEELNQLKRSKNTNRKNTINKNIRSWSIYSKLPSKKLNSVYEIRRTFKNKGKGIKVAVLDTGINTSHILFQNGKIKASANFIKNSNGYFDETNVEDEVGHGSHCAGIISGSLDYYPKIDISVAPESELYIGRVLNDEGTGSVQSICEGILWAIEMGVDVINMSLGYTGELIPSIKTCIEQAVSSGIIVCVAAGNEGPRQNTISSPGNFKKCITVGAVDYRNRIANFSSRGVQLDVVAPGVNILSCYKKDPTVFSNMSGTSMATPFVAGLACLWLEHYNVKENESEINTRCKMFEDWCKNNCLDLGKKGFDTSFGSGRPKLDFS